MSKATIQGIEVKVYGYYVVDGIMLCDVKYPHLAHSVPVIADLIDLEVVKWYTYWQQQ